ncbi:MAG: AAA family ATPase, partial [Desulfobacteria bacterium]
MTKSQTCETITIGSTEIMLANPAELRLKWVGQKELIKQVLAAWMVIDEKDVPFNPRLIGKPGVGKTTLGYGAARQLNREIYLFQATMDTRPEDLIITPVMGADGRVKYAASSLVTAMIRGGVCILDEGNRMSEKSWASLAPLLDDRRYVESLLTGLQLKAHPDFRLAVTMNEDASTFEIPEYIHTRLMPQIHVDFPEEDEERAILKENLPFAPDGLLNYM